MRSQDYIDGFNAAKTEAEGVAKAEFDSAHKELTTVRLAAGQRERTEVRRTVCGEDCPRHPQITPLTADAAPLQHGLAKPLI
jgi:hypothetical protein